MGYDTFFNVNITAPSKEEHDIVRKEIAEAAGRDPQNVDYGFDGHWYDSDKDLAAISARHPGVLIEVSGDGEESGDLWASRYRDGKSETVRFEGLPDFKEILTSQEQEEIFRKTSDAYNNALSALTEAALRRIRVLKDRITGEPDRLLSLERLNDDRPQIVIADSVPLSHREYVPLLVTAISADGKTVHTEQDSVELSDLLPKDLTRLFSLLESYVEDIDKGVIKRHWNGEEGVFELVFTLSTKVEDTDKKAAHLEPAASKRMMYQPQWYIDDDTNNDYGNLPEGLWSFQVFATREACIQWLRKHGYDPGDFVINEYREGDIEDPVFLDD